MGRGLPAVLVPPGDKQVTVSRCRHPDGRQLHGNESKITGTFTHCTKLHVTRAGITPKYYPALPSPGGKICDWERTDHGGARKERKRGFPPLVEIEIKTDREKKQQPREGCNYSTISYSFNETANWHSANRRVSADGGGAD